MWNFSKRAASAKRNSWAGELDTETVLRVVFESAKGSAASRQVSKEHANSWAGELDTETVLRVVFEKDAK